MPRQTVVVLRNLGNFAESGHTDSHPVWLEGLHRDPVGAERLHGDPVGAERLHRDPVGAEQLHRGSDSTEVHIVCRAFLHFSLSL